MATGLSVRVYEIRFRVFGVLGCLGLRDFHGLGVCLGLRACSCAHTWRQLLLATWRAGGHADSWNLISC